LKNHMLLAVTEMNRKDEIDALVEALKELSPKPKKAAKKTAPKKVKAASKRRAR
jgi:glycine cleavage system protein P-like pyridoxal-binding family